MEKRTKGEQDDDDQEGRVMIFFQICIGQI